VTGVVFQINIIIMPHNYIRMPLTGLWHVIRIWSQLQFTPGALSHNYSTCKYINWIYFYIRTDTDEDS